MGVGQRKGESIVTQSKVLIFTLIAFSSYTAFAHADDAADIAKAQQQYYETIRKSHGQMKSADIAALESRTISAALARSHDNHVN